MLESFRKFDWSLNLAVFFLLAAGLISLLSTAKNLFFIQSVWAAAGFILMLGVAHIDWRPFIAQVWFVRSVYILALGLLALTYFIAPSIRGIKAWLVLGPFQFQTSEFAKLALILIYSSFFAKGHIGIAHVRNLLSSFGYFIVPVLVVAGQPDLGSAIILFGIWFGYLLVSGIRWKHLALAAIVFSVALIFLWGSVLRPYQKERIMGLINPEQDPLGVNYNVIQSKISIGSAGFLGKGFGQGTQSHLGFLPEAQADFIFAAFVEEWGMIGGLAIIAAFLFMLFRILRIGIIADNNFAKFICLGAAILLLLHFILNLGSNLGLSPVVGVPLPFLSYGGSNLLINFLLLGMIQSVVKFQRF